MRPDRLGLAVILAAWVLLGACGGGGGGAHPDDGDDDLPPLLDASHLGWKNPACGVCHDLPEEDHVATEPPACAPCHGANGACDPNGLESLRVHDPADACLGCHGIYHGFAANAHCAACHFATAGLDDTCGIDGGGGGSGLRPSTDLASGCFGWPAADFTPTNRAAVSPSLGTGESAVDFTLATVDGTPVRLADLLATRPVLLVLGSFT